MAQVRWSLTAGNDLQDIEDFIARNSVLHAITFVDRMVESTEEQEKGTGYFSSSSLGLPRCRIVDSNPSVAAIFACQSSLPNNYCRFTQVQNVTSS